MDDESLIMTIKGLTAWLDEDDLELTFEDRWALYELLQDLQDLTA